MEGFKYILVLNSTDNKIGAKLCPEMAEYQDLLIFRLTKLVPRSAEKAFPGDFEVGRRENSQNY